MLFDSPGFLCFFPLVVLVYFILAHKYRWVWLLISSYYLCMSWNTNYAFLILASTIITYFSGILILDTDNDNGKKWIAISFIINLAILFFFKYFNFFSNRIEEAFRLFTIKMNVPNLDTLLPVGISFYTFQALSYTVDIYRGKLSPEKHLGKHVADIYLDRKLKENQIKKIDLWFYKPKTFGIGRQTIYQAKY